ncbi:MAG TPA: hypothetical protein ENH55_16450 [Aurantimonas coralicida]|uniref:3-hydroxyacyl-CoA dehydrogenase NAD binding domain-containing protein n=1 Tax=marine sediment metagenome TaxID=412755 RepID=A0A0F9UNM4_9ZZZZ|nr:hypothetical protein [Aurantimonas coralicida]
MSHEPQAKARVAVIGAGTMGKAIAGTFAQGGIPTILVSRDPSRAGLVETGVELVSELPRDPPCMIVEAVPEEMQLKIGVFLSVERLYGASLPVMASNTSGLPLQEIADRLERPDRFLGIHWFHPAGALPLVETVRVAQTSDESLSVALDLLAATGRDSLVVPRPVPGAVVNRLQHAILHEAYHLMSEGLAGPQDIDRAARWLLGPRMCVSGLIEQKDLGGLTGHILAQRTIVPDLCHDPAPNADVQAMLARGETGAKAGRGFYDWTGRDAPGAIENAARRLRELIAYLRDFQTGQTDDR